MQDLTKSEKLCKLHKDIEDIIESRVNRYQKSLPNKKFVALLIEKDICNTLKRNYMKDDCEIYFGKEIESINGEKFHDSFKIKYFRVVYSTFSIDHSKTELILKLRNKQQYMNKNNVGGRK